MSQKKLPDLPGYKSSSILCPKNNSMIEWMLIRAFCMIGEWDLKERFRWPTSQWQLGDFWVPVYAFF